MPDSYDGSWGDFSSQVAPDLGGVFNNQDYSNFFSGLGNSLGFTGNMFEDAPMNLGYSESSGGDNWGTGQQLSPEYLQQLNQLSYRPMQGADDPTVNVYQGKNNLGNFRYGSSPGTAFKLAGATIPGLVTGGFGAGLGALLGGGALASSAGNALASGGMTAARGGDSSQIGSSMLSSGLGSGLGATNPAGMMGLEGGLAKTVNAGIGGALGSAARGGNALQGGLSAMATTGLNNIGGAVANSFGDLWSSFGGSEDEFDQLQGSGGDMSGQTDVSPNTYDEMSPDFRFGGDFAATGGVPEGMQVAQGGSPMMSFSSFMPNNVGPTIGNYLGNNAGDLASMLYGFYNNKKQQKGLQGLQQQQQASLESLYGQNSPYAQQLRANLQAKAAASGKRLNTGAREVQLQAMLADRAAQQQAALGPQMYQNQMSQNNLKNNQLDILKMGFNKLGGGQLLGQGLQRLFGQDTQSIPYNSGNVSGSDLFGYKGSGGF